MRHANLAIHLVLGLLLLTASGRMVVAHQLPGPTLFDAAGPIPPHAGPDWSGLALFLGGLSSFVLAIGTTVPKLVLAWRGKPFEPSKESDRGPDA